MSDLHRRAARVLVRDRDGAVLLIRGSDPSRPEDGSFWFTPGGGLEAGEDALDAAIRELRFVPDAGGWTELEQTTHQAMRWWTSAELEGTSEAVFPADIVELLASA